jgi:hypothetical protein
MEEVIVLLIGGEISLNERVVERVVVERLVLVLLLFLRLGLHLRLLLVAVINLHLSIIKEN